MYDHFKIIKNSALVSGGLDTYSIMKRIPEYLHHEIEHHKDSRYYYIFNVGDGHDGPNGFYKQALMMTYVIEHNNGLEIMARFASNGHNINDRNISDISQIGPIYNVWLARSIIKIVNEDNKSYIIEYAFKSDSFNKSDSEQYINEKIEVLNKLKFFRFAEFKPTDYYNLPFNNLGKLLSDNLEWNNCNPEYGKLYADGQITLAGIKLMNEVTSDTIEYCKKLNHPNK